jgi:hypothetical protein
MKTILRLMKPYITKRLLNKGYDRQYINGFFWSVGVDNYLPLETMDIISESHPINQKS